VDGTTPCLLIWWNQGNDTAIYYSRALLASITLISQTLSVLSTCCSNKTIKGNNIRPLPVNYLLIQRFPRVIGTGADLEVWSGSARLLSESIPGTAFQGNVTAINAVSEAVRYSSGIDPCSQWSGKKRSVKRQVDTVLWWPLVGHIIQGVHQPQQSFAGWFGLSFRVVKMTTIKNQMSSCSFKRIVLFPCYESPLVAAKSHWGLAFYQCSIFAHCCGEARNYWSVSFTSASVNGDPHPERTKQCGLVLITVCFPENNFLRRWTSPEPLAPHI